MNMFDAGDMGVVKFILHEIFIVSLYCFLVWHK